MNDYLHVKEWRTNTKKKIIEALGGKCQICGYHKSISALEFHHINPKEKAFTLSTYMSRSTKPWKDLVAEASKCILLCANCHREVHSEITELPKVFQVLDETLISSNKDNTPQQTPCQKCGKLKHHNLNFCSQKCGNEYRRKLELTKEKLNELLLKHKGNLSSMSRELKLSDNGLRKICLRSGLDPKEFRSLPTEL